MSSKHCNMSGICLRVAGWFIPQMIHNHELRGVQLIHSHFGKMALDVSHPFRYMYETLIEYVMDYFVLQCDWFASVYWLNIVILLNWWISDIMVLLVICMYMWWHSYTMPRLDNSTFTVKSWSVFGCPIGTNNDTPWHICSSHCTCQGWLNNYPRSQKM